MVLWDCQLEQGTDALFNWTLVEEGGTGLIQGTNVRLLAPSTQVLHL